MNTPYYEPPEPPKPLIAERKELIFAALIALASLMAVNFTLYGGFNLGFAVPAGAIIGKVKEVHIIDNSKCVKCGACIEKCKFGAIVKK